ncbi:Aspartate/alanine antiporter [compost metagenome]
MLEFLLGALQASPEIAVFLAISLGVLIGRIQLGSFHLGSVAGALLMGLLIGQIGIEVPQAFKSVFFALFIYAVGFKSGPEFFGSLNRGTLKLVLLSVVLCATALGSILLMNAVFHFDAGFTAGLGAGALTDTAIMGTASSAINELALDPAARNLLNSHMAVAYAVTYLFGTIGLIVFVGTVAPRLLGIDLKSSARELERELGIDNEEDAIAVPYTRVVVRAHRVAANGPADGHPIAWLEQQHAGLTVERVVRDGHVLERDISLVLRADDILGAMRCARPWDL